MDGGAAVSSRMCFRGSDYTEVKLPAVIHNGFRYCVSLLVPLFVPLFVRRFSCLCAGELVDNVITSLPSGMVLLNED